ncbi:hypothetical protein [Sinosporangium siamense]|uniref:Beta-glucosidase n=1 Tax=Sinosporangium siamense TaxID=1367973 RepID=A0A919RIM8_9ACTN|nr:hypothetical protein [Sinosporangium siamense]GII94566.1 hypothetical protein Ssi02_47970 [Sinosporangium siamense]
MQMDRPAVMPELAAACAGLVVEFGACDEAVLDVLTGRFGPAGRLPFDLPSSMDAVEAARPTCPSTRRIPTSVSAMAFRIPVNSARPRGGVNHLG